jgi:hypothetical protein
MSGYTPHTWVDDETITDTLLNHLETQHDAAVATLIQGPFTSPAENALMLRLRTATAAFTFATVSSDGDLTLVKYANEYYRPRTMSADSLVQTSTASTTVVQVFDKRYILPAHDACTVKGLFAKLPIGLANTGSNVTRLQGYDIILEKISAAGVVTTLHTFATGTGATLASGPIGTANQLTVQVRALDYGAGYAVASGERLAIRIKLYGSVGNNTGYYAIGADGGSGAAQTLSGNNSAMFALTFA